MTDNVDHTAALEAVMDAVHVISEKDSINDDEVVFHLQNLGYTKVEAEKLNVFVPSAFSWPVLKKLGVASFPSIFIAIDKDGTEVKFPIANYHYFTAALTLAYEIFQYGWTKEIPRSTYEAIAGRSAEMDIVNTVYNKGGSVEGATLNPLKLLRLSAEELRGS